MQGLLKGYNRTLIALIKYVDIQNRLKNNFEPISLINKPSNI